MRILITNDDGINAPGLSVLEEIAAEIAGPEGEVWVVAPAFEQSGVGHCISYTHPTMVSRLSERRYAAEGSPADCVLAGLYDVLANNPPDLVLSGVNRGNNAGENVVYSGTIGGAMEAALQDVPAIALSQFMGPENVDLADPFEAARRYGAEVVRRLWAEGGWADAEYRLFYNVNFPAIPAADVKGIQVARQGLRKHAKHTVQHSLSPTGRRFLWVKSGVQDEMTGERTDVQANVEGFIAVTPLRADLTAHDRLSALQDKLEAPLS